MPGPGGKEVGRLSLKVLPDTSEFSTKLKAFAERVEKTVKIEIPVGINNRDIVKVESALAVVTRNRKIELKLDVDGKGLAAAQTGARNLGDGIAGSAANTNLLARNFLVLGPLVLGVASLAAGIAPAIASAVPAVFGVIGVVGALALGWKRLKTAMDPVIERFKQMRQPVGLALVDGLRTRFANLAKITLPAVQKGLVGFAKLINFALKDFIKFMNKGGGVKLLGEAFTAVTTALRPFAKLLAPLAEMFMRLSIAAAPALRMMGRAILDAVVNFNKFLATGKATGAITNAMRMLGQALSIIGGIIKAVFPSLVAMFPALMAGLQGFGAGVQMIFSVLKPVFTFIGQHQTAFAAIAAAITVATVAFAGLSAAMLVVRTVMNASPFMIIVTALAALAAGLIYAYKNSQTFRNAVNTVGSALKTAFVAALPTLKAIGSAFVAVGKFAVTVVKFIAAHWKTFAAILAGVGLVILGLIAPWAVVLAAIVGVVAIIIAKWSGIKAFFIALWAQISTPVIAAWNFIKTVISTAITVISTIIRTQVLVWKTIFALAWTAIKLVVQVAIRVVAAYIRAGMAVIRGVIAGIRVIVSIFRAAFNAARAVVSAVWGAIKSVVRAGVSFILGVIRGVRAVAGLFRSAFNAAKSAVTSAVNGIMSFIRGIPGKIKSILTFDLSGAGRNLMSSFGRGILAAGNAVLSKARAIASKIKGLLPGSPIKWGPLKSWNRGGAGIRLMNLLAAGIRARQGHVLAQVARTAAKMDNAWTVPSLADGFAAAADMNRMRSSLSASVGAIVDNTTSPGAQEIIIANWSTGRGTMAEIADDRLAVAEFLNQTDERMGVKR